MDRAEFLGYIMKGHKYNVAVASAKSTIVDNVINVINIFILLIFINLFFL